MIANKEARTNVLNLKEFILHTDCLLSDLLYEFCIKTHWYLPFYHNFIMEENSHYRQ